MKLCFLGPSVNQEWIIFFPLSVFAERWPLPSCRFPSPRNALGKKVQVPLRLLYLNYLLSALLLAWGSGGARRMAQRAGERQTRLLSEEGRREREQEQHLSPQPFFFLQAAPFRSASAACPEQRAGRLHPAAFGMHEHCCSHAGGRFLKEARWPQPRRLPSPPAPCPAAARAARPGCAAVRCAADLPVGIRGGSWIRPMLPDRSTGPFGSCAMPPSCPPSGCSRYGDSPRRQRSLPPGTCPEPRRRRCGKVNSGIVLTFLLIIFPTAFKTLCGYLKIPKSRVWAPVGMFDCGEWCVRGAEGQKGVVGVFSASVCLALEK